MPLRHFSGCVLLLSVLPSGAALAGAELNFGIDNQTHVHVDGSGDKYSRLDPQTVNISPTVRASCGSGRNVTNWVLIAASDPQKGSIIEGFDQNWPHKDGWHGSSRPMDWTVAPLSAPVGKLFAQLNMQQGYAPGQVFVKACNSELDRRVAQGTPRMTLLNSGFTTSLPHPFTFRAHCGKDNSKTDFVADSVVLLHNLNIKCDPIPQGPQALAPAPSAPPSGPATLGVAFMVTKIELTAAPSKYTGACPVDINFEAKLTATRDGVAQVRWVDQSGAKGVVIPVQISASGHATLTHKKTLGKPATGPTLGMAPQKQDIGQLSSGPGAAAGQYAGGYKLEIVSPVAPASPMASYNVQCKSGPSGPGNISPAP